MPNGWRTIKSKVHKIRLHRRRGKGKAGSFSREKLRHAPQKERRWMRNPVWPSSCVTPAGTSIEVQNEWEENTHNTHYTILYCSSSGSSGLLNNWSMNKKKKNCVVNIILLLYVCVCVCVFIKLHITAQSGPVIYSFYATVCSVCVYIYLLNCTNRAIRPCHPIIGILCHSHWSSQGGINVTY